MCIILSSAKKSHKITIVVQKTKQLRLNARNHIDLKEDENFIPGTTFRAPVPCRISLSRLRGATFPRVLSLPCTCVPFKLSEFHLPKRRTVLRGCQRFVIPAAWCYWSAFIGKPQVPMDDTSAHYPEVFRHSCALPPNVPYRETEDATLADIIKLYPERNRSRKEGKMRLPPVSRASKPSCSCRIILNFCKS